MSRSVASDRSDRSRPLDLAALACAAILTASYLSVLYHVVDVVGGRGVFVVVVGGALALAAVFRTLTQRQAVGLATVLLTVGLTIYLTTIPPTYLASLSIGRVISDTVALLTGFSVMRMAKAGNWALAVAPGPTFLTWYFVLRREHVAGALVGGLTLGFFVLTGDSGTVGTLIGVLAAVGLVAAGTLARHGAGYRQIEVVAGVFALMIVASATVTAVPGGVSPLVPPSATSVDGDLTSTGAQVTLGGSISLSPEVKFVVQADRSAYWRVSVYDRYTGSGWVRTGAADGGSPAPPPGPSVELEQTVTAKAALDVLPAAAEPVDVQGVDAGFTRFGDLRLDGTLQENETYTVVSEEAAATSSMLRSAESDYPPAIRNRYLQTPEGLSPRVADLAANVTANASSSYAKAVAIRDWLRENKQYSLDVRNPNGDVVETFLFDTDRGYCVYYASAMAVMLRSQGVPARFVVGYAPGQRVSENEWVVRGYDSHAWVEVYFPDIGWVRFDPTPSDSRQSAESQILDEARAGNVSGVDAEGSENGTWTPTTTTPRSNESTTVNGTVAVRTTPGYISQFAERDPVTSNPNVTATITTTPATGAQPPTLPPPQTLAIWGVLVVGLAAAVRRSRISGALYRELWLRWLPRGPSDHVVEGAFARVEYVLAQDHRPRKSGETVREYLDAVGADERARRVAALRERARYGSSDVTESDATEANELTRSLAADQGAIARIRHGDSV